MPEVSSAIQEVVEAAVLPEAVAEGKCGKNEARALTRASFFSIHQEPGLRFQLIQNRMIQKLYNLLLRLQLFYNNNIIDPLLQPLGRDI